MFTGLVDDVGTIERVERGAAGVVVRVSSSYRDLAHGESISVNGVCLTVREHAAPGTEGGWFEVAAMTTTVALTTIASWRRGLRVNLERALRPTDRLGGHIVQGHVDCVARVTRADRLQDTILLELTLPEELSDLMVERGSVALDGVSLTISALPAADKIQVSVIEFTATHTTLGAARVGDEIHVEADILAKHVKRLMQSMVGSGAPGNRTPGNATSPLPPD